MVWKWYFITIFSQCTRQRSTARICSN